MRASSLRLNALLAAVAALALVASACYSRVELKPKTSPPASRIAMKFDVSQELVDMPSQTAQMNKTLQDALAEEISKSVGMGESEDTQQARAAGKVLGQMGTNLEAQLKGDLLKMNLGFPVVDEGAEADLRLEGTFRPTPYNGIALDWQLVEVSSQAVVRAGVAERSFADPNVEPFADQILADLLQIDIDVYAGKGGGSAPTAAGPSGGSVDDAPPAATDGSNAWAVIIGIEKYRDELPEATFAENDARAFAAYAENTLGVPPAHIKLLIGERAGKADIASVVEEWLPKNAVNPGGRVYVYFSGHGAPDTETGDAYLVPYDADPAYIKTRGYPLDKLYGKLESLKGQQSMVFLDSCFSGSGGRSVLAKGTRPLVPVKDPTGAVKEGVIAFAAASAKQTTGAARDGGHGLFTHHLLAAMGGAADADGDKNVTLGEIASHVGERVSTEARLDNREQTPTLKTPSGVKPEAVRVVEGLK